MSELIHRVRSGDVQLRPTEHSGWYDHQTWSLEPLLLLERQPEAPRLELGKRYRQHLEELFRGTMALTRETHVKALALGGGRGGYSDTQQPPIYVRPDLTVEPLPSLYARRAASYQFVQTVLEDVFGADTVRQLHRLMPEGACDAPLSDELVEMQQILTGAAQISRRELGMEVAVEKEVCETSFADWQANIKTDRDLRQDGRMMVPVFYDLQRRKTKVWAFLGWRRTPVNLTYKKVPQILAVEELKEPEATDRLSVLRRKFRKTQEDEVSEPPPVEFSNACYELATPVMAEVYVDKLLNRDEFRRHCNRYQTQAAILANLR